MKKFLRYIFSIILLSVSFLSNGQQQSNNTNTQDSVIQLYGVVMTADSLRAIDAATVYVEGKGRGTITNDDGVFSIVVLKGDKIKFSCVGFKDKIITIPSNLSSNQFSVIQLMVNDTVYLPATIIKARPTRSQFERDFVNTDVPDDEYEIARKNNDVATLRTLMATLPVDGREAINYNFRQQAQKYYYAGQMPPQNIFNPVAWAQFIEAWKRGDFRSKK